MKHVKVARIHKNAPDAEKLSQKGTLFQNWELHRRCMCWYFNKKQKNLALSIYNQYILKVIPLLSYPPCIFIIYLKEFAKSKFIFSFNFKKTINKAINIHKFFMIMIVNDEFPAFVANVVFVKYNNLNINTEYECNWMLKLG